MKQINFKALWYRTCAVVLIHINQGNQLSNLLLITVTHNLGAQVYSEFDEFVKLLLVIGQLIVARMCVVFIAAALLELARLEVAVKNKFYLTCKNNKTYTIVTTHL